MATEQKTEKTPATAKSNGKPKIKKDGAPEKIPLARCSTSSSHNRNGANSTIKAPEEELVEVTVVGDSVQVPPKANGIDGSKKKKKEDKNKNKKKMKDDDSEEKDGSLLYQIPMNRVIRIIKSEDPNIRIAQEAVYIINKASEKFLQVFTTEAYASAFLDRKKNIDYKHLSSVVSKRRRFDFLSDFVPEKLKAEDALRESPTVQN